MFESDFAYAIHSGTPTEAILSIAETKIFFEHVYSDGTADAFADLELHHLYTFATILTAAADLFPVQSEDWNSAKAAGDIEGTRDAVVRHKVLAVQALERLARFFDAIGDSARADRARTFSNPEQYKGRFAIVRYRNFPPKLVAEYRALSRRQRQRKRDS